MQGDNIVSSTLSRLLYSITSQLSTNNKTSRTNICFSQFIPPGTHTQAPQRPNKHYILSLLPFPPHLHSQNLTSKTLKMTSNLWITTSLLCLQNIMIQVPRQTIKKKNSQRFYPDAQPMKTASRNWASKKHIYSPCQSISQK